MKLSIAMMVKNEESNLERCLKSLQPLRDAIESELIIVDTGSQDKTVEIAKQFTDKVYFHPWNNDFSAMRNITINYAVGEWIFILDADEVLENIQPLIDFLHSSKRKQYGVVAITVNNIVNLEKQEYSSMISFRMFKKDGYFHYEGAVHNQARFKGESLAFPEVYISHYGYIANDKELMERKFLRTSMILKEELEKDPLNAYYWAQLSVTYAMHNNYTEAITYAEKAYSVLPAKKAPNHMFVLVQMLLVYQHEGKYERVAEVGREALGIKDGYLDVYYYYAESQTMLKNYSEAIIYYEKYLDLLKKQEQLTERDTTIIEYSLGYEDLVYYNLSQLVKEEKEYDKALYYAEKIKGRKYIKDNILNIIELYLYKEKFKELYQYYHEKITNEESTVFFDKLVKKMEQRGQKVKLGIANVFCEVNSEFGLLCTLILEDQKGYISVETQEAVMKIKLENLPVYCSDIIYYLLKWQYPLEKWIADCKETWLNCAFDYIAKQHDDLCQLLYIYLQENSFGQELGKYKLGKALARYALLLDKLNDAQYRNIFEKYIDSGISYIQAVYSNYVIDNVLIYELKNDEEMFLLYVYYAQANKHKDQAEYAKYLRKALQAFPAMNQGVGILLNEMQSAIVEKNNEFDSYKNEVKATIKTLITKGEIAQAKAILLEYKSIVPDDLEAVLLESKIMLH